MAWYHVPRLGRPADAGTNPSRMLFSVRVQALVYLAISILALGRKIARPESGLIVDGLTRLG